MPDVQPSEERQVAYYSAILAAWVETRFEVDRQLLTLSCAGTGVIVTLLTTIGASTCLVGTLYGLAIASFVACMTIILIVFRVNSRHLEAIAEGKSVSSRRLNIFDAIAAICFVVGVLAAVGAGSVHAFSSAQNKSEAPMSQDEIIKVIIKTHELLDKSLGNFEALQPKPRPIPEATPPTTPGGDTQSGSKPPANPPAERD